MAKAVEPNQITWQSHCNKSSYQKNRRQVKKVAVSKGITNWSGKRVSMRRKISNLKMMKKSAIVCLLIWVQLVISIPKIWCFFISICVRTLSTKICHLLGHHKPKLCHLCQCIHNSYRHLWCIHHPQYLTRKLCEHHQQLLSSRKRILVPIMISSRRKRQKRRKTLGSKWSTKLNSKCQ